MNKKKVKPTKCCALCMYFDSIDELYLNTLIGHCMMDEDKEKVAFSHEVCNFFVYQSAYNERFDIQNIL